MTVTPKTEISQSSEDGRAAASPPVALAERGLHIRGLSKTFPGVRALRDVDLHIRSGSVHALLGHNGCGKSTLVKALSGFHSPDPGCEASIDGHPLQLGSTEDAAQSGLRFVHQDMGLVHELGAVDNVGFVLGYDRSRIGVIQWRRQARRTSELLATFGIRLDPRAPLSQATPVERTAVAIVRAIAGWQKGRGLLVLDEPTAALPAKEVDELFKLIREIRDSGTAVLLVSHRLDEVMAICDHATVMSAGQVIWDGGTHDMSVGEFAKLIAGDEDLALDTSARARYVSEETVRPTLEVANLSGRYLRDVSFSVRPGEILGVAGLLGSGREELPYVVAGAVREGISGQILVEGKQITERSVRAAQAHGVVLVPAERASEAIVGDFTVRENVTLAALPELRRGPVLPPAADRAFARKWLHAVDADPKVSESGIATLSGGNQQKAVLARWLSVEPKLLAVSEPTAGIDIGARTTIYAELRTRAEQGLSILMSSSDPEDLIAVCHRVLVLRDGQIMTELEGTQITKRAIATAMEGVHSEHI